jgi:hypothetical protein
MSNLKEHATMMKEKEKQDEKFTSVVLVHNPYGLRRGEVPKRAKVGASRRRRTCTSTSTLSFPHVSMQ